MRSCIMSRAASRIASLSCWCTCRRELLELDVVVVLIAWVVFVVLGDVVLMVVELTTVVLVVAPGAGRALLTHTVSQPLKCSPVLVIPVRHRLCSPSSRSSWSALNVSIISGLPSPLRSPRTLGIDVGAAPSSLTLLFLTFETSSDGLPYRMTLTNIGRPLIKQSGLMAILAVLTTVVVVVGGCVVVVVVGIVVVVVGGCVVVVVVG